MNFLKSITNYIFIYRVKKTPQVLIQIQEHLKIPKI